MLGAAIIAVLVPLNIANLNGNRISIALPILSLGAAAAIIVGWIPTRNTFRPPTTGIAIDAATEPALVALVRDVATTMGAAMPDLVYLVHDVNAAAAADSRLLGLRVRRRSMELGLGLLSTVTADELRAIVAHELGHHAAGDTRLAPVVYRGQRAIVATIVGMGRGSILLVPYVGYLRLYLRCAGAVSRSHQWQKKLQWGRALVSAEGAELPREPPRRPRFNGAALW